MIECTAVGGLAHPYAHTGTRQPAGAVRRSCKRAVSRRCPVRIVAADPRLTQLFWGLPRGVPTSSMLLISTDTRRCLRKVSVSSATQHRRTPRAPDVRPRVGLLDTGQSAKAAIFCICASGAYAGGRPPHARCAVHVVQRGAVAGCHPPTDAGMIHAARAIAVCASPAVPACVHGSLHHKRSIHAEVLRSNLGILLTWDTYAPAGPCTAAVAPGGGPRQVDRTTSQ